MRRRTDGSRLEARWEYTAGTTGIPLALVCVPLGYHAHFACSDAFRDEKRRTMRACGATLTAVPSDNRKVAAQPIRRMIRTADGISRQSGNGWCDQLHNRDGEAGYQPRGEALWRQERSVSTGFGLQPSAHQHRQERGRHGQQGDRTESGDPVAGRPEQPDQHAGPDNAAQITARREEP